MPPKVLFSCMLCLVIRAQDSDIPATEAQAAVLRALVQQAPRLALERTVFKIREPSAGFEIGYPSAVTTGRDGTIYVLQRGEKADPVLALDRQGRIVRSWGRGMFQIPHSIRIDRKGNIWTVDSSSSRVYEFTPKGEKLLEISVGEQPASQSGFAGTTDIAFAPNGHLFISDGYGNARVLEYTADGKRLRQWGSAGTGPGQFHQPHGIAIDDEGVIYVADRRNGRIQRFDLTGRYLGEWSNLGMTATVTMSGGSLWIGTQQRNLPTTADGWIMKIDRRSGKILGCADSGRGHHIINAAGNGDLLSGARPDTVLWFRAAR